MEGERESELKIKRKFLHFPLYLLKLVVVVLFSLSLLYTHTLSLIFSYPLKESFSTKCGHQSSFQTFHLNKTNS